MAMSPLEGELVNTVLYCDPRQVIYRLLAFKSSTINKRKKMLNSMWFPHQWESNCNQLKELPLLQQKRQILIHINDQHRLGSSLREAVMEMPKTGFPRAEKGVKLPSRLQLPRTHRMLFEEASLLLGGRICSAVPLTIIKTPNLVGKTWTWSAVMNTTLAKLLLQESIRS